MYKVALTGHRPNQLWGYSLQDKHYRELYNLLYYFLYLKLFEHDKLECHSGMALGADQVWAQAICRLKQKFPDRIIFVAEIPCPEQAKTWSEESKKIYNNQLKLADNKNVYSDEYTKYCMLVRDRGMVDNADDLIAIYDEDKKTGGTYYTLKYAKSHNKNIYLINPKDILV